MQQAAMAGLDRAALAGVFITHAHSDHFAGYLGLVAAYYHLLALMPAARNGPIPVWGPDRGPGPPSPPWANPSRPAPSITDITAQLIAADATELNVRPGGRAPVQPHDLRPGEPGFLVMEDDRVRVTAATVEHPPTSPALAYRFDTDDGAVVFSGDTAPTSAVVTLARHADVLIHEAYDPDWVAGIHPVAAVIFEHTHSTAAQAGHAARQAGVERLVLNHLIPGDPTAVTDKRWAAAAQAVYPGTVTVGRDLQTVDLGARALL
jgi:ribonuclease BN (tRNA processing enzyme)